jgi:2-iminobutanoate/2-iminopropanoate deaminase
MPEEDQRRVGRIGGHQGASGGPDVRVIQAAGVPRPVAQYSQAVEVRASRLLFISGQVPVDGEGNLVGAGDAHAQIRQAFANVRALVEEAGGTLANVVELTVYLRDMVAHRPLVTELRGQILAPPYPATTMVEVSRLAAEEWLVEISATAAL